jgi:Disulfide bond chaperones of the HSP33 family
VDFIKRYTTAEGLRLSIAVTTDTIEEARVRHDLWPVATAALGRTMTGAILMASDFKNDENVSIRLRGDGPLGIVHVDAFSNNTVRGYVDHPHVDVPLLREGKLDVGAAVGRNGEVQVTRFTKLRQNYTSQSPIQTGEVAEDLAYYLAMSEQVGSVLSLGVLVDPDYHTIVAGGFLVQALPDVTNDAFDKIEANLKTIGTVTNYLKAHPNAEQLMERILDGFTVQEVYNERIHFACPCSRERFFDRLASLPMHDKKELAEDEVTELTCHYCNEKYHFSKEDMQTLLIEDTH